MPKRRFDTPTLRDLFSEQRVKEFLIETFRAGYHGPKAPELVKCPSCSDHIVANGDVSGDEYVKRRMETFIRHLQSRHCRRNWDDVRWRMSGLVNVASHQGADARGVKICGEVDDALFQLHRAGVRVAMGFMEVPPGPNFKKKTVDMVPRILVPQWIERHWIENCYPCPELRFADAMLGLAREIRAGKVKSA